MGISREQAIDCFRSDDLIGMGMEADAVRRGLHPEGVVSYVIEETIRCGVQEPGAIYERVRESEEAGATGVRLETQLAHDAIHVGFERLLCGVKERFPALSVCGCSVSEILLMAKHAELPVQDALMRLQDAGLDTISTEGDLESGGADREPMGMPSTVDEWMGFHRAAHALGMRTTASMILGRGEGIEDRVDHLAAVRRQQEETGGFVSFTLFTCTPRGTAQGREEVTSVEYLKTLAISRMYLHNIEHIETSAGSHGLKVLQMGLRFGADDVGSVMPSSGRERVPGRPSGTTEEELRRVIRDAGFRPVERDKLFRVAFLN